MDNFWNGFEKQANAPFEVGPAGVMGGALSGYYSGRSAAGTSANALSRKGYKTKNEETARNIAKVTGALGALGGLALGLKHKKKITDLAKKYISSHPDMSALYEGAVPFAAGTAGGAAAGAATGGLTALRGAFKKQEKKAAFGVNKFDPNNPFRGLSREDIGEAVPKKKKEFLRSLNEAHRAGHIDDNLDVVEHIMAFEDGRHKDFWNSFKKKASIPRLIGTVTGARDLKRGYKIISDMVRKGQMTQAGHVVGNMANRKAVAGQAMAGGLARLGLTGAGAAYALRDKGGK